MISEPINQLQEAWNELCRRGGGQGGGPARTRLQEALRHFGQLLNADAHDQMMSAFEWVPEANPWHVAFAMGLCWGSMAKREERFFRAAVGALQEWNDEDRREASRYYLERGAEPIERSLLGGHMLFRETRLPPNFPETLEGFDRAQQRWLTTLERLSPPFIGPWNALAMFMSALFTRPELARSMRQTRPYLPTGGPITAGLNLLHRAHVIGSPPNTEHDDERFAAISAAVVDNSLMEDLVRGQQDWSMLDVHSGIYLLGTRDRRSRGWLA